MTLFNNNTFSCVATFVQMAGIAALTGPDEPVLRMNEIFRARRDRLVEGLNEISGISCLLPEGAFYAFPNVSAITQDDRALAKFLLEEGGVACGGGSSFGAAGKGYLRFSYAASLEDIDWALALDRADVAEVQGLDRSLSQPSRRRGFERPAVTLADRRDRPHRFPSGSRARAARYRRIRFSACRSRRTLRRPCRLERPVLRLTSSRV